MSEKTIRAWLATGDIDDRRTGIHLSKPEAYRNGFHGRHEWLRQPEGNLGLYWSAHTRLPAHGSKELVEVEITIREVEK